MPLLRRYRLLLGSTLTPEQGRLNTLEGTELATAIRSLVFVRLFALLVLFDVELCKSPAVSPVCPRYAMTERCDGGAASPISERAQRPPVERSSSGSASTSPSS